MGRVLSCTWRLATSGVRPTVPTTLMAPLWFTRVCRLIRPWRPRSVPNPSTRRPRRSMAMTAGVRGARSSMRTVQPLRSSLPRAKRKGRSVAPAGRGRRGRRRLGLGWPPFGRRGCQQRLQVPGFVLAAPFEPHPRAEVTTSPAPARPCAGRTCSRAGRARARRKKSSASPRRRSWSSRTSMRAPSPAGRTSPLSRPARRGRSHRALLADVEAQESAVVGV